MYRPRNSHWQVLVCLGSGAYPFLVFAVRQFSSPWIMGAVGLGMVLLQLWRSYRRSPIPWLSFNLGLSGLVLLGLLTWWPASAATAYPVLMSLAFGASFLMSLIRPPSLIEIIARLGEPDLPPFGVTYTYWVTVAWAVFLFLNAAISESTALWGSIQLWTLWNGLISYLLMGVMFAGEYGLRLVLRRRFQPATP